MDNTDMTVDASLSQAKAASLDDAKPSLAVRIAALKAYLVACAETCADYYAAATLYDQLSGLSDAELHRRGLSRDTLARDITGACDRTSQS
jgi:hypothetical protein